MKFITLFFQKKKNDISVCFDECLILKQINAEKLLFKNKFNFIKCIFHEKIDFSYSFFSTTCIEENVSFKECTFKFNVFLMKHALKHM